MRATALVRCCSLATLAACADESVLEVGYIEYASSTFVLEVPDLIVAAEPFTVSFATYGNSCVSAYSTGVAFDSETAFLTPFDVRQLPADGACDDVLQELPHPAQIVFATPGMKTVRVHGRKLEPPMDSLVDRDTMILVQ